jgi:cytochrome c oxidase subunit IV
MHQRILEKIGILTISIVTELLLLGTFLLYNLFWESFVMIVAIIIETFMVYFFVALLVVKGVKEGVNVFKKKTKP